jgi:SAM-dependent methyltransferase
MSTPVGSQHWDPERYERNARFVAELGAPLLELLAPRAGERILDLGCGDGFLTERLAALGCEVVGVDSSPEQVAATQRRGLAAHVARAEALPFVAEFDAVLSNAVLHWVKDAAGAIAAVRRALRPGGRFVAELGGAGCVAKIRAAIGVALARRGVEAERLDPWFFPSAERYGALLEAGGFTVGSLVLFPRPTALPGDVSGWLETFAEPFLGALPAAERADAVVEIRELLRPQLFDSERGWSADYVRLRFAATRREG